MIRNQPPNSRNSSHGALAPHLWPQDRNSNIDIGRIRETSPLWTARLNGVPFLQRSAIDAKSIDAIQTNALAKRNLGKFYSRREVADKANNFGWFPFFEFTCNYIARNNAATMIGRWRDKDYFLCMVRKKNQKTFNSSHTGEQIMGRSTRALGSKNRYFDPRDKRVYPSTLGAVCSYHRC
ncbi:hypothetical protein AA313_de0206206 [Arthrobotrys entomopaga]|nr:hypothetical protein AA313_de0206206 [Arthrobotrys entomopaga]